MDGRRQVTVKLPPKSRADEYDVHFYSELNIMHGLEFHPNIIKYVYLLHGSDAAQYVIGSKASAAKYRRRCLCMSTAPRALSSTTYAGLDDCC